jgi:glucokinase
MRPPLKAPVRAIAMDLGGTRFRVAVGTSDGEVEWRVSRLTFAEQGPTAVINRMFTTVDEALKTVDASSPVRGIGIAAPGPLDPWSGVIHRPPNLPGWDQIPLKQLFEDRFGIPVRVGNDANWAAVGEHRYGAGKGYSDVVYITVSTGVGGGIIIDNRLLLGHCGFAGELGHMTIDPQGPLDTCGNTGCLEAFASGTAIARRAVEMVMAGAKTSLSGYSAEEMRAELVQAEAYRGDEVAVQIMRDAGTALGVGVLNIAQILNPQRIILGGGVAMGAGPLLWDAMLKVVRTRAMTQCQQETEIVPASLGDDAGLVGAIAVITELQGG